MKDLSKIFDDELIASANKAKLECGFNPAKLIELIAGHGGVKTVKTQISRGKASDGFDLLAKSNRLELTIEASVVKSKYSQLFTDDEVNFCLEMLVDNGYFG